MCILWGGGLGCVVWCGGYGGWGVEADCDVLYR